MYDIIIIGAGTAGLTAAIYARRAFKKTLVLEASAYGGQIINTPDIENFPAAMHISGFEYATKLYEQAKELGAEIVFEKAVTINDQDTDKTVVTDRNRYETKAVIIATGSQNRKLGLTKEEELVGRGISYCATCDGAFYRKKKVAVIGGGNTALEDALYLSDLAEKVYLIHRRDAFRGEESTVSKLQAKDNVEFVLNSNVTRLNGTEKLQSIEVTDKLGNTRIIEVDGIFVAVGRVPQNDAFADLVELDDAGYILSGENCHTKTPGIFVAGDNRVKEVRQLVTAASDGAIAATEAVKYLSAI
ncbi:MAG: thioredoxin-disulfide reductase [Erysipelotrichaceae bacterium]|nr:thioredoxin-disulfide reductase [Erysipelotrichaceae bacterium]